MKNAAGNLRSPATSSVSEAKPGYQRLGTRGAHRRRHHARPADRVGLRRHDIAASGRGRGDAVPPIGLGLGAHGADADRTEPLLRLEIGDGRRQRRLRAAHGRLPIKSVRSAGQSDAPRLRCRALRHAQPRHGQCQRKPRLYDLIETPPSPQLECQVIAAAFALASVLRYSMQVSAEPCYPMCHSPGSFWRRA